MSEPARPTPGERIDLLAAQIEEEIGPGIVMWATIICDGCGAEVEVEAKQQEPPEGWMLGGHRRGEDFCPACWQIILANQTD